MSNTVGMSLRFSVALPVLFVFFSLSALGQNPDDIIGDWMPDVRTSYIHIYREGNAYFGKIEWMQILNDENGEPRKDPDGKPLLKMVILKDFIYKDGEWEGGTVYDPRTGKTYYCSMQLVGDDKLRIRGSIDPMGWLGRTETWVRHED